MTVITERNAIKLKAQKVDDLKELIRQNNTVAIAELYKVRAAQLQQLSKKFREDLHIRVIKNNILIRAFQKSQKPSINEMTKCLLGSNILLLTDMNPFKLAILLDKNKTKMKAKAGDIAPNDIMILAGNTGLPPGPAISELHDAGVRTKIDIGSVWIIKDTTVVNKGEIIQPNIASVLSKLGIKPLEIGLTIKAAYDQGAIFTSDQLRPNIDEVKKQLENASIQGFNLAINSIYPTTLTVKIFLQRTYSNARNLAINSNYLASEVIQEIITKAYNSMMSLTLKLAKISNEAVPLELRQTIIERKVEKEAIK